ncbi:MAG TPA: hypothetical protein VGE27_10215 [Gemmatimonas sp.]|uniref:hypothetical protein n=1 Tax=Gemmatimonas sp. TaxID=1962908 RepID=UPI002EDB218E
MSSRDVPLEFGRIIVIGGGCYGSWYTQQLGRAFARGVLRVNEVIVVDRNHDCTVAMRIEEGVYGALPVRLRVAAWDDFLDEWLGEGVDALRHDAMVPSPLMPHVCLDWLMRRAASRWPGRAMRVDPLDFDPATPWQRAAPDGRHYVSFATWICPTNCIEPVSCPAIKAPRDWSMPVTIGRIATLETAPVGTESRPTLRGTVSFHCVHRTYGVGMIDAVSIAEADVRLSAWGGEGPCRVLVGTMSHCHGALGVLALD